MNKEFMIAYYLMRRLKRKTAAKNEINILKN